MWNLFRLQRYIIAFLVASFFLGMLLGILLITNVDLGNNRLLGRNSRTPDEDAASVQEAVKNGGLLQKLRDTNKGIFKMSQDKLEQGDQLGDKSREDGAEPPPHEVVLEVPDRAEENAEEDKAYPPPNYNVHIFYYPWYGNPEMDGKYLHWNHMVLPHWDPEETKKWPEGQHMPPDDIGANFYPALGPYSSRDPKVMDSHMQQIRSASIGVLAVSWYPPNDSDDQGDSWDDFIPDLLDAADKYQLKMCFHIEPYKERDHVTLRQHIAYINKKYGSHPAFYRKSVNGRSLPLYYIYDSYLVSPQNWAQLFKRDGALTVRGTELDALFIGLMVESKHKSAIISAGFDGFYTYFASDGFTYGSNTRSWSSLTAFSKANKLLFIPSVGPGYIDVRIRPWNARNTKAREGGGYYEQSFQAALLAKPPFVSITSFNEWHEGTQIEKAVPKQYQDVKYLDYLPGGPEYYLQLTRKWVEKFTEMQDSEQGR